MRWIADGWLAGVSHLPSPNWGVRPPENAVSLIVIHGISLPPGEFEAAHVEDFFLNRLDPQGHPYFATIAGLEVSSHFYVRRDGKTVQFVACDHRAWHAGRSIWRGRENCNDFSIGIELEGDDERPFAAEQYDSLWRLIDAIRKRYPIQSIAGHCHIAPGRKTDPGSGFSWAAVRERYPSLDLPPREEKA